jgi:SAM-dependent methyltransferase
MRIKEQEGELPFVLNLGAGSQDYGDVRVDFYPSASTTAVCDASRTLPFRSGVFSEVYSRCLFEHLRNPGHFLDEAFRVLRPGGRLVLITDHAGYWRWHLQIDHSRDYTHRSDRDRHFALYSPGHLRNFCESSGFTILFLGYEGFDSHTRLVKDRILERIPGFRILAKPRLKVVALKPRK